MTRLKKRLRHHASAVFLCLIAAIAGSSVAAACRDGVVDLRGDFGTAQFRVELADTPELRQRGLMFRQDLPQSAGMLFVYPSERPIGFWMRNTYVPLDMIFADGAGVVQKVHSNAVPLDETVIFGGEAIQLVLEINAGLSKAIGIAPGSQIKHGAINQNAAAWPCK